VKNRVFILLCLWPIFGRKRLLLLALFQLLIGQTFAQQSAPDLVRVIPPSPTAAAMARYGEIPVSTYTGVPNISIPLYEIINKELKVPVVLSYHSGGTKVEDEASWVGLGWSLMAGGSISRIVNGMDDLSKSSIRGFPDSYLPTSIDLFSYRYVVPQDATQRQYDSQYLVDVLDGLDDTEPDIFVFNFNGRSGKFALKKRSSTTMPLEPVLLSQEDLKIEVAYSSQAANYQWVITDEMGVKYFFNTTESTISRSNAADEEYMADVTAPEGLPKDVVSSWYLDRIVSPTGAEINFSYYSSYPTGRGTKRILSRSQVKKHVIDLTAMPDCIPPMNEYTYFSTYTEVHDVYLKEITFPNGKIEFKLSDREDIEPVISGFPTTYAKKVDEVIISAGSGSSFTMVKKYLFSYSYFNPGTTYAEKRLKLLSVTESNGVVSRPPYLFTYDGRELPAKDWKSVDHWGYYNGAPNNSVNQTTYGDKIFNGTLVPPTSAVVQGGTGTREFAGADREPNLDFAKASILTGITYPTGGTTAFSYELNDYYDPRTDTLRTSEVAFTEKFGPDTQVPNHRPDNFTLEFATKTRVTVGTIIECYSGNDCLDMGGEYEYDVANIKSADGGTFNQWIGYLLTYDNQGHGTWQETTYDLPAGKYQFTVYADQKYVSRLMVSWEVKTPVRRYNSLGAGLRIKSITEYDGISHENDKVTEYGYATQKEAPGCSTGKLMLKPLYEYHEYAKRGCLSGVPTVARYLVRSSTPVIPFGYSAQGNQIGYDMVEVTQGNNGKTVYEYYNEEDNTARVGFPGVPPVGFIGNGLLKRETAYVKNADGSFSKLKAIGKTYVIGARRATIKGMKIPSGDASRYYTEFFNQWISIPIYDNSQFYDIVSEWVHPQSDTITQYSQDGTISLQQIINYNYTNSVWRQLSSMNTTDSKKKTEVVTYKYPYDFPSDPVCTQLVSKHRIGNIIEESSTMDNTHVRTVKTNFATWSNNQLLPQTIDVRIGGGALETRVRNHAYAPDGSLLSQSGENDMKISYKWGYNNQYPVVEIANAGPDAFYYESFEEGTNIGVAQAAAKTGKKVKATGFVVNFTLPDQRSYVLSYWYRTGTTGEWKYKQVDYPGPAYSITDGTYIDEVRICPKDASMKTYTCDPLIGITSETDISGKTLYYEYDGFNQLKLVKDADGKIIGQYDYQYQKPITQ
jgi:hypothetical protein